MLWLLVPYRRRITLKAPDDDAEAEPQRDGETKLPALSVIVYAAFNADDLEQMLPLVLRQEYPGEFEVIVINDGSSLDLADVVKRLQNEYPNLRHTFVPEEAHNLSRKKLAISLGIKAAKHDYIVLTTAGCKPASLQWLRLMGRHFAAGKQVVLGWSRISGLRKAMPAFDQIATGATWLSAALGRHPYRGTGNNLAYARKLFFDAKGFSRSMNMHNGDDDLFVNQIVTPDNTAVELSPGARMSVRYYDPLKAWREMKMNHAFTARFLPKGARIFMGFSTIMMWVWIAAIAVAAVFSIPNLLPSCLLILLIPALWIPLTKSWQTTGLTLGVRLAGALLWWQILWRWTADLKARFLCNRGERRNYTWWQK